MGSTGSIIRICAVFMSTLFIAFACLGYFHGSNAQQRPPQPPQADKQTAVRTFSAGATAGVQNSGAQNDAEETAWNLILVNNEKPLPDDYEVELTNLTNGQAVDKRIYPALQEMFDAARSEGVYPVVASGYRTAETQQSLLAEKIAEYQAAGYSHAEAVNSANAWVAAPGASEHQLGIAVDINADGVNSTGPEVYAWLDENACKFGFICRYPAGKTEITGIIGEPWHYRYVGVHAATEIYNQKLCLEEYLGAYEMLKKPTPT